MNNQDHRCSQCGSKMVQTGTEYQTAIYHCRSCGNTEYVQVAISEKTDYLHKRSMLLGRVRKGVIDWEITQWDALREDIMNFTIAYHAARNDIYMHMKVYKRYLKDPSSTVAEMGESGAVEYEDYRKQYKQCRNEYRNTKLAWKLALAIGKKLIPIPKI